MVTDNKLLWSRFLCRCHSGVEQPSALGDVISVPFWFSENVLRQFYLLVPSRHNNTFLCFILSPCHLNLCRFTSFLWRVLVYSAFTYRGLAFFWCYATLILFVLHYITLSSSITSLYGISRMFGLLPLTHSLSRRRATISHFVFLQTHWFLINMDPCFDALPYLYIVVKNIIPIFLIIRKYKNCSNDTNGSQSLNIRDLRRLNHCLC